MSPTDPLRAALERALGAQYEIVRLLGRGGMGAVYLARERALERTVAIKVLPPEIAVGAEAQERFRREARTAAKLTHPNIVPLHTFGEVEGMMYFVMGYVEGESLADRMQRDNELPPAEVRRILGAMADALHYAHRQGVIHRDIKPDNILLEAESGRPMLTDFGIAKASASQETLTELGTAIGTPHYMSPEQASGERGLDGRSDLYSLGVVGYAMLAGRVPFEGASAQEVLVQHVTKAPPELDALAPGVPADLAKAIMRCLAKAPEARWPNGASLQDAVSDVGQADEVLIEKRAWFDGLLIGRVAPICWLLLWPFFIAHVIAGNPAEMSRSAMYRSVFSPVLFAMVPWGLVSFVILATALGAAVAKRWRWTQVLLMAFRQPRWWRGWYPAPLRHPATAPRWTRLPRGVQLMQTVLDVTVLLMLVAYLPAVVMLTALPGEAIQAYGDADWPFLGNVVKELFLPGHEFICVSSPEGRMRCLFGAIRIRSLFGPIGSTLISGLVLAYIAGLVWAKTRGLTIGEAHRLFGGRALAPTHEAMAFWKRPHVARLLSAAPSPRETSATEPETLQDYLSQIDQAAKGLTGTARELGNDAAVAARQLVAAVEEVDKEIEKLAHDVDPAEIPRLEEKLADLSDPERESEAGRQIRELVSGQLKLLRQLAQGLKHVTERRSRLMGMLNTLWLQMGNLRAEAARESLESEEVTGKIRAICEEIERHAEATEEVDQLVSPSETE